MFKRSKILSSTCIAPNNNGIYPRMTSRYHMPVSLQLWSRKSRKSGSPRSHLQTPRKDHDMILEKDCRCTADPATEQFAPCGVQSLRQGGRFRPTPVLDDWQRIGGVTFGKTTTRSYIKLLNHAVTGKDQVMERICEKGETVRRRSLEPVGKYHTDGRPMGNVRNQLGYTLS
jgi:hypothetical protein